MKIQEIELETRLFIQLIFREYRIELINFSKIQKSSVEY